MMRPRLSKAKLSKAKGTSCSEIESLQCGLGKTDTPLEQSAKSRGCRRPPARGKFVCPPREEAMFRKTYLFLQLALVND